MGSVNRAQMGPMCHSLVMEFLATGCLPPPAPRPFSTALYNLSASSSRTCREGGCESSVTKALRKASWASVSSFQAKSSGRAKTSLLVGPLVPASPRVGGGSGGCESVEGTRKEQSYQDPPYYCISCPQHGAFRKH